MNARRWLPAVVAAGSLAASLLVVPAASAAPAPAAAAAVRPCAQMGHPVTMLGVRTPTCTLLYTSGPASVLLPADGPRIVYGVVNAVSAGVAPSTFTSQSGRTYPVGASEGKRWTKVTPARAAQTIVAAEIVNGHIGRTFPYLFITDDAITDRFAGKTFISQTTNAKGSKSVIRIWTRIDWAGGLSDNGGLTGVIANYKKNVREAGTCKPAMVKQHISMVKQRFGQKGKVDLSWRPGTYQGEDSLLTLATETSARFTHPAPTALVLAQKVWKPGKVFFTLAGSDAGLAKVLVNDIRGGSAAQKCSLA